MKKCLMGLLTIGATLVLPSAIRAQTPEATSPVRVAQPRVELLVHGSPQPTYRLGHQQFVEGAMGQRYVIRVHNPTWRRVEAVISVDGRDAIDGRPASHQKRGYVIEPHGYADIDGFRLNAAEVAAFRFTTVADSYAARMGSAWRVGEVDVQLFPELVHRLPHPRSAERDRSPSRADARSRGQGLGTEFGERRVSPVRETQFVRESWNQPSWRVTVRYDDAEGLCARGIRALCPVPPRHEREYAEPPPGWYGGRGW